MQYHDFIITVHSKSGNEYLVSVDSPAGNDRATLQLNIDELGDLWLNLNKAVRGPATPSATATMQMSAQQFGARLYSKLFTGMVNSLWHESRGQIRHNVEAGLRVKLKIASDSSDTTKLITLPWEFLYEKEKQRFLNLDRRTPIVRYLEVHQPIQLPSFEPPLRILVIISKAAPKGIQPLDLDKERQQIQQAWAKNDQIQVDFLERATTKALRSALLKNYHVLHFMGHGDFDAQSGSGVLLFEDEYGDPNPIRGQVLGTMLQDRVPPLRLAFLNACQTASFSAEPGQDLFAGVATSLVMKGLPAVIAMQFPISDEAALTFAGMFYSRLAQNDPVDAATAESRLSIYYDQDENPEWGTPVLFMRTEDGYLFTRKHSYAESTKSHFPPGAEAKFITTTLSKEAQEALQLCIEQYFALILAELSDDDRYSAQVQRDNLYRAFLSDPINFELIRSALLFFENLSPTTLKRIKTMLQEPTLQYLARKSGKQQEYEQLIFAPH